MKRAHTHMWCLGVLVVAGCGGGGGSSDVSIAMQPMAGKIGGQAWTFGTGETDSFLSMGGTLYANLYAGSFATCANAAPSGADTVIIGQMPMAAGSYNLSLDLNVTFYVASTVNNYVATSGKLVIDGVVGTTISGGLHATYNADNTVDGQFHADICP